MLRTILSLFLTGIFLGSGPCLISCGPFLVSFVAGAKKNYRESLGIWLIFSLTRLFAYLVLGIIAGFFSQEIVYRIYQGNTGLYLLLFGGVFILLIGLVIFWGGNKQLKICRILEERFVKRGIKSTIIFGLVIGFLPCAPLLAVLSYVVLVAGSWHKGLIYSLSFGLGTLISPLIVLVLLASMVPKLFSENAKFMKLFQKICGLIIILLGLELITRVFR